MRERHSMSRYVYPEDRFAFARWADAPGPCNKPYWWVNKITGQLAIELEKNGKRLRYDLTEKELFNCHLGWRWLISRAVMNVRNNLRSQHET